MGEVDRKIPEVEEAEGDKNIAAVEVEEVVGVVVEAVLKEGNDS